MKYWLLTTEYPPQFGGGIGTYCYQWCRQLVFQTVEVTVFLVNRNIKGYQERQADGVRIVEFDPYFEKSSSYLGYETMISLSFERIIELYITREGAPGWIESQEYNAIAYYILQKKHLGYSIYRDVNVVINCHCPSFIALEYNHVNTYRLPHFWVGEMEKFCIKAADVCISPSQYLIDIMLQRDAGLQREYTILRNPLAVDNTPVAGNSETSTALFLGKLSPIKGIMELLRAFTSLWDEGYNYILKLAGDEHYYYHAIGSTMGAHIRKRFEKYIQQGLLVLLGNIDPSQLDAYTRPARVIVLPSTFDNFPYTILEMMARQKLVLTSNAGGHNEILHDGEDALVYHVGDLAEFRAKIHQAFTLPADELQRITVNAAYTVKTYCDPVKYFNNKMDVLKKHAGVKAEVLDFPFLRVAQANNAGRSEVGQKDLLSVVVPFYNMGTYVTETIDSINMSTYKDVEIIIVDDGSNDKSSICVLEQLGNASNIRIIRQQNAGLPSARNKGAEHAKGEFLAFLDADDKVAGSYYQDAINILRLKRNVHFVGSWVQYFGEAKAVWPSFTPEPPYLLFHNMVNSSGLIYRRQSFLRHGMNDPSFQFGMEDYDSVISMVKNGMGGVVIPELFFHYRVRKNSMARSFNKSNMSFLYQLLAEKHKSFYTTFATEIINLVNANGAGYNYENPTMDYHLYPGESMQSRVVRNLILKIKRHPQLRKIALNLYKRLN